MEEETLSRFVCFACGAWGSMETARAQWREVALPALAEASSLPAARPTPPPAAVAASQAASGSSQAALRCSLHTGCACSSTPRPGSAACCLPGRSARQPRRSVPAAARHFPGTGAAAGRWLCGAGYLAAYRTGLAWRPRCLSSYDAGRSPREPVWACGRNSREGFQGEAPRSSARGERLLQRRRVAGRYRTAVGVRGRL